jgi:hypothetical protein
VRGNQPQIQSAWMLEAAYQAVAGESHHEAEIRKATKQLGGVNSSGEIQTSAVLVPEPKNRYDSNAIAVTLAGFTVGYLPKEDAARYIGTLGPLAEQGCLLSTAARLWSADFGDGFRASVSLLLGPPDMLLPFNSPPSIPMIELPEGNALQVTGEEHHLDVLTPIVSGKHQVAAYTTLHVFNEQKARSTRELIEVQINGRRVGQLTPTMSDHLLPAARRAAALGVQIVCRAKVQGNALKVDVTLYPTRAGDLPDAWLDQLEQLGRSLPASPAGTARATAGQDPAIDPSDHQPSLPNTPATETVTDPVDAAEATPPGPPAGWFPNPTGPGLRWWNGTSWTEHTFTE